MKLLHIFITFCMILVVLYMTHSSAQKKQGHIIENIGYSPNLKDTIKASLKPMRAFIEESQKEHRHSAGIFGVSSRGPDIRSPFHIESLRRQKEIQQALESTNYKNVNMLMRNADNTLTQNQIDVLGAISQGQPIPTAIELDAIEDMQLSPEEYMKLLPQFKQFTKKSGIFNHKQFSIQTRPGSAEVAMESQLKKE